MLCSEYDAVSSGAFEPSGGANPSHLEKRVPQGAGQAVKPASEKIKDSAVVRISLQL